MREQPGAHGHPGQAAVGVILLWPRPAQAWKGSFLLPALGTLAKVSTVTLAELLGQGCEWLLGWGAVGLQLPRRGSANLHISLPKP